MILSLVSIPGNVDQGEEDQDNVLPDNVDAVDNNNSAADNAEDNAEDNKVMEEPIHGRTHWSSSIGCNNQYDKQLPEMLLVVPSLSLSFLSAVFKVGNAQKKTSLTGLFWKVSHQAGILLHRYTLLHLLPKDTPSIVIGKIIESHKRYSFEIIIDIQIFIKWSASWCVW
jgi:hypothetical protein